MSGTFDIDPGRAAALLLEQLDALDEAVAGRELPQTLTHELHAAIRRGRQDVAARLDAPLRILVMGDFKRGKSSLINALVGSTVAPTDSLPETAMIHLIGHGEAAQAWMCRADGVRVPLDPAHLHAAELRPAQAEVGEAAWLESRRPIEALRGVEWIDTPGTGDPGRACETEVRRWLVRADLLLVVFGAEAPLSATEAAFLRLSTRPQDAGRLIFVVNRCDVLPGEADLGRVLAKARERLAPLFADTQIVAVSALRALSGGGTGDAALAARLDADFATLAGLISEARAARRNQLQVAGALGAVLALADAATRLLTVARAAAGPPETAAQRMAELRTRLTVLPDEAARAAAALRDTAAKLQASATAAILGLIERLGAYIAATGPNIGPRELRRYLPFFVADTLRQGIEACLADHLGRLQTATESTAPGWADTAAEVAGAATPAAEAVWTQEASLGVAIETVLPGLQILVGLFGQAANEVQEEAAAAERDAAVASRQVLALKPLIAERIGGAWHEAVAHLAQAQAERAAAQIARLEAELRLAQSAAAQAQAEHSSVQAAIAAALADVARVQAALAGLAEKLELQAAPHPLPESERPRPGPASAMPAEKDPPSGAVTEKLRAR